MRRGGEVLLVHQGSPGRPLFWALPGGLVDEGELAREALSREVREETGLELVALGPLAFVRQVDERRAVQLIEHRGPGPGYLLTVWVFEVDEWSGELDSRDPDGVVSDAAFVALDEAVARLRRTHWLEVAADYLAGRVAPGSVLFERRHADGRSERLF